MNIVGRTQWKNPNPQVQIFLPIGYTSFPQTLDPSLPTFLAVIISLIVSQSLYRDKSIVIGHLDSFLVLNLLRNLHKEGPTLIIIKYETL